jgi:tetratricopeptide (TPR) repeat protein
MSNRKRGRKRPKKNSFNNNNNTISTDTLFVKLAEKHLETLRQEAVRTLKTQIGDFYIHDSGRAFSMSKKALGGLLFQELTEENEYSTLDELEQIIFIEKLIDLFPNEADFHFEKAYAYLKLGKKEKAEKLMKSAYEQFKGYTPLDVLYGRLRFENDSINLRQELFGEELNPHKIYPNREAFTEAELIDYLMIQSLFLIEEKDFETAEILSFIIGKINPEAVEIERSLRYETIKQKHPKKYKVLNFIVIMAKYLIIGLIIWGIVAFIRWIIGLF